MKIKDLTKAPDRAIISNKPQAIYWHHTATSRETTVQSIMDYHTRPKELGGRGYDACGYHYLICLLYTSDAADE